MTKVSVVIPTYKRNDYLIRAIESVLKQDCKDFEIIVVDDNDESSSYRTLNEEKLKKYVDNNLIKYIKHKNNKNGAAARNTGIDHATGDYITFLDDDDEFEKSRISNIIKIIKEKNPDFICTGVVIKSNGKVTGNYIPNLNKSKDELIVELLNQKSFIGTGSNIVCKKEIVNSIHGFDDSFIRHQDIEFMIRVLEVAEDYVCIPKYLVVKNNDDGLNIPNFEKLLKTKIQFLKKFDYILNSLNDKTKRNIYISNYYELLYVSYLTNKKEDTIKSLKLIKENNVYKFHKVIIMRFKFFIKKIFKKRAR